MTIWIDEAALSRAVDFINDRYADKLPDDKPLSMPIALEILRRFRISCDIDGIPRTDYERIREEVRNATAEQPGLTPRRAEYYRKAIAAYRRFPKKPFTIQDLEPVL